LTNFEKNVLLLTAEKMWRFGFGLIEHCTSTLKWQTLYIVCYWEYPNLPVCYWEYTNFTTEVSCLSRNI